MRIGFEAKRLFCNHTGLGNYSRTLVANLASQFPTHDYLLFTPKVTHSEMTKPFHEHPHVRIIGPEGKWSSLWRLWGMGKTASKEKVDIFHGLSNELPGDLGNLKSIVTIHDLIFRYYPNQFGRLNSAIYDWKFKSAAKNASLVVAISEATKNDIQKFYDIPENKIRVVYQGCDAAFQWMRDATTISSVREKYALPLEYSLIVGSIIERKNLLGVVRALALLKEKTPLVVIGSGGEYKSTVEAFISQNGLSDWVHFRTGVPSSDLPAIYQGASCFLYPSVMEGFGIPILEALWSRVPVITSKTSCLPEAGGPGSLLVDPKEPEDIAHAWWRVLSERALGQEMREKGLEHAKNFTNDKVTARMMEVYKELHTEP